MYQSHTAHRVNGMAPTPVRTVSEKMASGFRMRNRANSPCPAHNPSAMLRTFFSVTPAPCPDVRLWRGFVPGCPITHPPPGNRAGAQRQPVAMPFPALSPTRARENPRTISRARGLECGGNARGRNNPRPCHTRWPRGCKRILR